MDAVEKYFNFLRKYNDKLREKKTDWLGPADLSAVLVESALENIEKERDEK